MTPSELAQNQSLRVNTLVRASSRRAPLITREMQKPAHWMQLATSEYKEKRPLAEGPFVEIHKFLAIASHGPKLFGQKVVRRPGAGYHNFTVLELLGGCVVAVLVLLDGLGVDQVGNVE